MNAGLRAAMFSAARAQLGAMSPQHAPGPLTAAQLRELRCMALTGDISDLLDHGQNALAFYARDRVIGALERKGLIVADPDWSLTDAGRAVVAKEFGIDSRAVGAGVDQPGGAQR